MFRVIASTFFLFLLPGITHAAARDPAMGAAPYVAKKVAGKAAEKAMGVDGKIGTNKKIEDPGSKEHKKHIEDLKDKGQYKDKGKGQNKGKGGAVSK